MGTDTAEQRQRCQDLYAYAYHYEVDGWHNRDYGARLRIEIAGDKCDRRDTVGGIASLEREIRRSQLPVSTGSSMRWPLP